jgi:endonuclease YncB( thermonuclease family)
MAWVRSGIVGAVGLVAGIWLAGQWLGEDGGAVAMGTLAPATPGAVIAGTARVIDGDTLRIGGTRIRLQGIDAPEGNARCQRSDGSAWTCGAWASEVARGMLEGRRLLCDDLGERTHNRVVARCRVGEADVAALLLEAGAAHACARYARQHSHSRGYMALEAAAAAAGRGIFEGHPPARAAFCGDGGTAAAPALVQAARSVADCTIKGNIGRSGERIYHMPGQAHYDRVTIRPELGERWFCSSAEARAAGWRRSQR